jgi:hypothetical protein
LLLECAIEFGQHVTKFIYSSSNTDIVKFNTKSVHDTNTLNILTSFLWGGGGVWNIHIYVWHEMFMGQRRQISSLPTTKNILKMKAVFWSNIRVVFLYYLYVLILIMWSAWIHTTLDTDRVHVHYFLERAVIHLPCLCSFTWTLCILHHRKWKCFWMHCFSCLFGACNVKGLSTKFLFCFCMWFLLGNSNYLVYMYLKSLLECAF